MAYQEELNRYDCPLSEQERNQKLALLKNFKEWYMNDKYWNFDNPINKDYTLVAKYEKNVVVSTARYSNSENKRKVCLALKSQGLNNNAVAAIMANVVYETGFNPNLYGCGGQCYGIVQWYKGRFDNLKEIFNLNRNKC